jgi:glycerol kinase
MVKNTYGTGSFVLMNTGDSLVPSKHGLVTTIAWKLGDEVSYALEGSIFSTGATIQWLRDGLELFDSLSDVERLAALAADNGGVYLVPAFTGLGAPHWDMYARGAIVGITRGTSKSHLARAALEATAYQTKDVIDAMFADTGIHISKLRVDGGGSQNSFLMQFQSDLLGVEIECSAVRETTALGAAYLAGLAVGFWESTEEIQEMWARDRTYTPDMSDELRDGLYDNWKHAVERAKGWANRE